MSRIDLPSEEYLFAMMSAARRMSSWATWLEFGAMRELALRHPATPRPAGQNRPAGSALTSVQAELPGPFSPDHDREVAAYVGGEIAAAELYRRTVARYRKP